MNANCTAMAVHKLGFCAITLHIIQEDGTSSLTKDGSWEGSWTWEGVIMTMFAWITLPTRLHWMSVHFTGGRMLWYSDLWIMLIKVCTWFAPSTWKLQLWGSLLSWKFGSSPGPHPQPNPIINTHTNRSKNYAWIYHGITPSPGCRPKLTGP